MTVIHLVNCMWHSADDLISGSKRMVQMESLQQYPEKKIQTSSCVTTYNVERFTNSVARFTNSVVRITNSEVVYQLCGKVYKLCGKIYQFCGKIYELCAKV